MHHTHTIRPAFNMTIQKMKTKIVLRNIYYPPLAGVCLFVTTLKMLTSPPVLKLLDWIPSVLVSFLPNYYHFKYLSSWIAPVPSHTQRARKMATGGGHICEYLLKPFSLEKLLWDFWCSCLNLVQNQRWFFSWKRFYYYLRQDWHHMGRQPRCNSFLMQPKAKNLFFAHTRTF